MSRSRSLKYVPAVVMAALFAGWIASVTLIVGFMGLPVHRYKAGCSLHSGCLVAGYTDFPHERLRGFCRAENKSRDLRSIFGHFEAGADPYFLDDDWKVWTLFLPLPCLLLAFLPLAIGSLISFRFRIWHYLAYMMLVAVELAYYSR